MAFSTSNVVRESNGSVSIMRGNWSGAAGDTSNGTITGSGQGISAEFYTNNTTSPENVIPARITTSSGVWTASVPYTTAVTNGTFVITFK